MSLACRTILLLTTLGVALPAMGQDDRSLVDLQGLDALRAAEEDAAEPPRPGHAELEAAYEIDQEAEQERRRAESRIKSLIGERVRIHRRDNHLEAEMPDHFQALLAKSLNQRVDSNGCGSPQRSESTWVSLKPTPADSTPLRHRRRRASAKSVKRVP